jgi:intracellular sulfur oxidation DsrE/DsrF family protein
VKIAIVLHGEATKSVLNNAAYKARFQIEQNPNLPLIRELQKAGVEVLVCGQALNYNGFPDAEVLTEFRSLQPPTVVTQASGRLLLHSRSR